MLLELEFELLDELELELLELLLLELELELLELFEFELLDELEFELLELLLDELLFELLELLLDELLFEFAFELELEPMPGRPSSRRFGLQAAVVPTMAAAPSTAAAIRRRDRWVGCILTSSWGVVGRGQACAPGMRRPWDGDENLLIRGSRIPWRNQGGKPPRFFVRSGSGWVRTRWPER
ncbi:hypothetical protein BH18ACT2_BH18ACT2_22530 [soil metagenome]